MNAFPDKQKKTACEQRHCLNFYYWLFAVTVSAAPVHAANFTVLVGSGGNVYVPATLTVSVGDTVTFRNAGGLHNVKADDNSFRCANGCDHDGHGGNGDTSTDIWHASVTFSVVGNIGYYCEQHGNTLTGMRGMIIVKSSTPVQLQFFDVGQ